MGYWDYDDYWSLVDAQNSDDTDASNRDDYDEISTDKMLNYMSPGNGTFWWDE